LFAEELGMVLQVREADVARVRETREAFPFQADADPFELRSG